MLKAILFDADGVVINPAMQFSRHLETAYGITRPMTSGFFGGVFNDCLNGRANLRDVLPPFLDAWGWQGTVDAFIALWMEKDACPDVRLLAAIQDLRQQGYLCGLATLQERNRADYMRNRMGFNALFDQFFFSCELGCQKPQLEYYQAVEQALGLQGSEILFWDDAPRNVLAARDFGWQAETYLGFEAFSARLPLILDQS